MLFSIHCETMTKISYLILRTDIVEVLLVGYQVTRLLGVFLWKSVGQYSHLSIQTVLHVIHTPDSSTPLRLDTYTPTVLLRLTGFMGVPRLQTRRSGNGDRTHVDYYLRPPFMSEVTSVVLVWSQCVRGVMGHTPLTH
jgi:hypothetical protein